MSDAKLKLGYQIVEKESGSVRFLAFLSYVLSIFLAWNVQFLTVSNFAFLGFHHIASPLSIVATFFQRGTEVAVFAVAVALLMDLVLFSTSLVAVIRCFSPDHASLDCPDRILQGSWLIYYSGQHSVVTFLELLSLLRYVKAVNSYLEEWEKKLLSLPDAEARKLATTEAQSLSLERSSVVERRLHLFALVPTIFFWVFCAPLQIGWLAVLAGSRVLRDGFGVWVSFKYATGSAAQAKFFDTFSKILASVFLIVSLAAWLYAEEMADPTTLSWEVLVDGAHSAFGDPWSWTVDGFAHMTTAPPEPFLLTFVFIETLILANRYGPVRG